MKIGIDISQLVFHGGVVEYLENLVTEIVSIDTKNEYILFGSTSGSKEKFYNLKKRLNGHPNVSFKLLPLPLSLLNLLWNKLHIIPIEAFIGNVDIFISSDWTEPPVRSAKKLTILYDLIVYKYPAETAAEIISTQKRKLYWVAKETDTIICISESTKKDAMEILNIPESKLKVIYPGFTL